MTTLPAARGNSQLTKDPLLFVSTSKGQEIAQKAKQIISKTEKQKKELKITDQQNQFASVDEAWQLDLDSWRSKRLNSRGLSTDDSVSPAPTPSPRLPETQKTFSAYEPVQDLDLTITTSDHLNHHKSENQLFRNEPSHENGWNNLERSNSDEILTISSPRRREELASDSGIENHYSADSSDFSPRSEPLSKMSFSSPRLFSPLSNTSSRFSDNLDQIVVPLKTTHDDEQFPPPPAHLTSPPATKTTRTFRREQRSVDQPFTRDFFAPADRNLNKEVELTVEVNREQKAIVSAVKSSSKPENNTTVTSPKLRESSDSSDYTYQIKREPVKSPRTTSNNYRTVDIVFDDSASSYRPPRQDKDGLICLAIELGSQPVHKGFGFTVKMERGVFVVDSVIVGTPADRHGLQIGDRIDSIDGQNLSSCSRSRVEAIIHDAARMGDILLRVERKGLNSSTTSQWSNNNPKFQQNVKMFQEKQQTISYSEFKKRKTNRDHSAPAPRSYNSLPRNSTAANPSSYASLPRPRNTHSADYKVTNLDERTGPGKLSDFVPEVERQQPVSDRYSRYSASEETTTTIRNYDVKEGENKNPRDWRKLINEQRQPSPGVHSEYNRRRIQELTSSMSNLPTIIASKNEEARKLAEQGQDYDAVKKDATGRSVFDLSKTSTPQGYQRNYPIHDYSPINHKLQPPPQQPPTQPKPEADDILAVSGKHLCAHCGHELGRGAAMLVESLGLYYHLTCFTCYVCHTALGSGETGADVRVRDGHLHCQSCYSNDKLQLSKV